RSVTPSATYHRADASLAHGATELPLDPLMACSTPTSPPSTSTSADTTGDCTASTARNDTTLLGGTVNGSGTGLPADGTHVMMPCRGWASTLAINTVELNAAPAAAVPAAQYHVAVAA